MTLQVLLMERDANGLSSDAGRKGNHITSCKFIFTVVEYPSYLIRIPGRDILCKFTVEIHILVVVVGDYFGATEWWTFLQRRRNSCKYTEAKVANYPLLSYSWLSLLNVHSTKLSWIQRGAIAFTFCLCALSCLPNNTIKRIRYSWRLPQTLLIRRVYNVVIFHYSTS